MVFVGGMCERAPCCTPNTNIPVSATDVAARVLHPNMRWPRTRNAGRSSRRCGGGVGVHAQLVKDKLRLQAPIGRSIFVVSSQCIDDDVVNRWLAMMRALEAKTVRRLRWEEHALDCDHARTNVATPGIACWMDYVGYFALFLQGWKCLVFLVWCQPRQLYLTRLEMVAWGLLSCFYEAMYHARGCPWCHG